jgi:hypothetical protein
VCLVVLHAVVVSLMAAGSPETPPVCDVPIARWIARCARTTGMTITAARCVPEQLVLIGARGDAELRVEVGPASRMTFRIAGRVGLAPVGEWADWGDAPPAYQHILDDLVGCAAADPTLPFREVATRPETVEGGPAEAPWPWRPALGAFLLFLALLRTASPWRQPRWWLAGLGLTFVTFVLRWLALEVGFVHQNGQGPLWIAHALGVPSSYGLGQRELFGLVANQAGEASAGIFGAQALLGALGPICAGVIARSVGAGWRLTVACVAALALCPLAGRLVQSESYLASGASILLLAGAGLAGTFAASNRVSRGLGLLGAGCLIAAAARIHPYTWPAAALLPLIVACVSPARPIRTALLVSAGLAVVVGGLAGSEIYATLFGSMGQKYASWARVPAWGVVLVAAAPIAAHVWIRTRATAALATASLVGLVAAALYITEPLALLIPFGYGLLYTGPLLALFCVALAGLPRLAPAVVAVSAVALGWVGWGEATSLYTDAAEQRAALQWSANLPDDSRVIYLSRLPREVLLLPIYGDVTGRGPRAVPLRMQHQQDVSAAAGAGDGAVYYYDSSLCARPGGAVACAALRQSLELQWQWTRRVAARPSNPNHPYLTAPVGLTLWRVVPLGVESDQ